MRGQEKRHSKRSGARTLLAALLLLGPCRGAAPGALAPTATTPVESELGPARPTSFGSAAVSAGVARNNRPANSVAAVRPVAGRPEQSASIIRDWIAETIWRGPASTVAATYFFAGWDREAPVFLASFEGREGELPDEYIRAGDAEQHDRRWTREKVPFAKKGGRVVLPRGEVIIEDSGYRRDAGSMTLNESPPSVVWYEPGTPAMRIAVPDVHPPQRIFAAIRSPSGCRLLLEITPQSERTDETRFVLAEVGRRGSCVPQ